MYPNTVTATRKLSLGFSKDMQTATDGLFCSPQLSALPAGGGCGAHPAHLSATEDNPAPSKGSQAVSPALNKTPKSEATYAHLTETPHEDGALTYC